MKILIAGNVSPLTAREELYLIQNFHDRLKELGYIVDMFMLPIVSDPLLLPEQMMALRLMDTTGVSDIMITIGYPSFLLKHPRKKVVLFSLSSHLHEWYNTEYGILETPEYNKIKKAVQDAEKKCLEEAENIFCASHTLSEQLKLEYSLSSVHYIIDEHDKRQSGFTVSIPDDSWIMCETTLEPNDRIDLLLDLVRLSDSEWKLLISVPAAYNIYRSFLIQRIKKMGIDKRVLIVDGILPEEVLLNASACISFPYNSVRIPSLIIRAVKKKVPVITTTDSGALLEIVKDNINGVILKPFAAEIASVLDKIILSGDINMKIKNNDNKIINDMVNVDSLILELVK